jgi:large subunit ribosomal protein L21
MYAIVKSGGKQYRVERGQRLLVERLAAKEGSDVALQPLLYRNEEAVFDEAGLAKVQVTARVIEHVRGEKLRVLKFKPKRGYKRRTGHRQPLTRIEVTEIAGGRAKAPAQRAEGAERKPAARAKAPAKRPAKAPAKAKPAAERKPAARKPAARKPPKEQSDGS